jgi:hypothetical protein
MLVYMFQIGSINQYISLSVINIFHSRSFLQEQQWLQSPLSHSWVELTPAKGYSDFKVDNASCI